MKELQCDMSCHPNLKHDYFGHIDTKEKAYWLGFLMADGTVFTEKNGSKRIILELKKDDVDQIESFISAVGANREKIYPHRNNFGIRFVSSEMFNDLNRMGCVEKKSKILQMPHLPNDETYLAFLLGYYDGNGKQNSNVLFSGSKMFLDQIKVHFAVPSDVKTLKHDNQKIEGRLINGTEYSLILGSSLFNAIMDNYTNSMKRKRRHFDTNEEKIQKIRAKMQGFDGKPKLIITKEELADAVWKKPTTEIAKEYGVSDKTIEKRCIKWEISKPPRGYWSGKKRNG